MNNETPSPQEMSHDIDELILDMEAKLGHRVADITPDIYNQAYLLKGAAENYAASACKSRSARSEMQRAGRSLFHKVLYMAYLLGWDLEDYGEHLAPSQSLHNMIHQIILNSKIRQEVLTDYYSKGGVNYEGD